ncbi:hypothetical protein [Enterococcus asini]|uniref:hypothetical protein n=1 Tax=Enterococcus asini TaxID=57732 RepID=UPI0022E906B3|nr:hypothetical protein [Enterococcus asini]
MNKSKSTQSTCKFKGCEKPIFKEDSKFCLEHYRDYNEKQRNREIKALAASAVALSVVTAAIPKVLKVIKKV